MGQPMPLSGQPPPGTSGMAPHNMAVVSTAAPQSEYMGGAGDTQPLPPEGGEGGWAAWDPSPGAVLCLRAPPPHPLRGQRSAPGPVQPQASEGGERGCTVLLAPLGVAEEPSPRASPRSHRNTLAVSPEPPQGRALRPTALTWLVSGALWACTCVARGGLVRCGRESARGASPPAGRPGVALQP